MANVDYRPKGYSTLTPYLVVKDGRAQLEFLKKAFDAKVEFVNERPDGSVGHASLDIGDSKIMIGQAMEGYPPMPAAIYMYVPDCDAVYKSAIAAGGKSKMEPADMFYGDRNGGVEDPNGNQWWMATHIEDVAPEELERRAAAAQKIKAG
jgi:PhnB protein